MTTDGPIPARARAAFWVAVLLLVVTALAHLQLPHCIGDCGDGGTGPGADAASCCTVATDGMTEGATDGPSSCCGCCSTTASAMATMLGNREHSDDDGQSTPQGSVRGTCAPGCRLTITFEGVDFAPAPAGTQLTDCAPVAFVPLSTNWPTHDRRPLARGRPFDRGPPRVDARTALRACIVLLI